MTLPLDTLNKILAAHSAASGVELDTDVPAILVPDQFKVTNIENLRATRARFRGCMATDSIEDFVAYVTAHGADTATRGFIQADNMSCTVFFNLGDAGCPGHGDDTAKLKLRPTAALSALFQIAGKELSQTQLAEWMEDWHQHLRVIDTNDNDITVAAAVQNIRKITIRASAERTSSESNFSTSQSAMDQIEAAHADKQPAELRFRITPYEGLGERTFVLRLSILTGGDKPRLRPRWVQQEAQEEELAQEFKEKLTRKLPDTCQLTVGSFTVGQ